jgi:2-oxo-3-hexenedioate decarboxylase
VTDPQSIAAGLVRAERTRTPVVPFTHANPFLSLDTAYLAQRLFVQHRLDQGERLVGAKLGLTSKVKRQALGINEPMFGRLTSRMVAPHGEPLSLAGYIKPRAEPEIAFLIGKPISGDEPLGEVLRGIDAVLPAIEIVDSRYSAPFRLADSVADNGGAASIVLGTGWRSPGDLVDLSVLGCVFRHHDGIDTAAGGAVMGHPVAAIQWLARALSRRGEALEVGSIVLSGGLTASVLLRPNTTITAEFDGLGAVDLRCN